LAEAQMNNGRVAVLTGTPEAEERELLECLRKIGKGLIAAGSPVGTVETALTAIADAYGQKCEIVALPNTILIKLGESPLPAVDFSVQGLTSLKLDQMSELGQLIDKVQRGLVLPREAVAQVDRVLAMPHRFRAATVIAGYFLSSIGLTLLYRPDLLSLVVTGAAGILVGAMTLWFEGRPRFKLLLPVIAAFVVSTVIFNLAETGLLEGSATLIVPPLITFLPGAVLTTGMIELASMNILSGSARLMYGLTTLFFLYVGIAAGLTLSGLPRVNVYALEASEFPWWAPLLGTFLFGVGAFIRLSGANRDLAWMLLVLYVAMLAQSVGERFLTPYFGAFLGATAMTLSSEMIARSAQRTPALVASMLAFWFLVPGARGLLGVTSILGADFQSAAIGLSEMVGLMGAISLGVLLGTLAVSPQKFVMAAVPARRVRDKAI
jgi:uncharacterized membrane protein YjjP (DUF1212 family)